MIFSLILINKNVVGQAFDDVQIQLNTARYIYNEKINIIHLIIDHLSSLDYLQEAIQKRNRALLYKKLNEVKKELDLDIINITDENGRIIYRTNNPGIIGDVISGTSFIKYILNNKKACSGTDIIRNDLLAIESKELAEQAYIKVIPTPRARIKEKAFEDSGLILIAASPVYLKDRFIGIIYGAKLLNNDFELVDRIKNLVFKDEKLNGFDVGTATIFQDDLRISTNVKKIDGTRAVGTRVSAEVYSKVVEHEQVWLDKAFVVNKWYISAYEPIYNFDQKVVGILYVGILEEKYNIIRRNTTYYSLAIMIITALIAVLLSIYLIRTIINPINSLVKASNDIALGNFNNKLDIDSEDEMGYLCNTFNKMIDAIVERDNKLKEHTEMQIVKSEKLASLGRLASGIAHEINNPLTGVLSYSTSLFNDLKNTEYKEDLDIIINETLRCREIVKGILNFARETRLEKNNVNINTVISEVLLILERHVNFQNIVIKRNFYQDLPDISIDINQIKSVINNLAVNSADAMPDGGELTITTDLNKEKNEIIIEITDTGIGISEENLDKIFDPFFTTKETGKGTGLGLAVTYGIIRRHNGWIGVHSKPGQGTKFIIGLPVE
jgi:two-component system NtrC family sensor kinase